MNAIVTIAKSIKVLAVVAFLAGLALAQAGHISDIVPMDNTHESIVKPITVDAKVIAKAEAQSGGKCVGASKPVLTDTIVVLDDKGTTRIETFDGAYAGAKAGTLTVLYYCK